MKISVIIPTCNEEEYIGKLVQFILQHGKQSVNEVIVVDGHSQDNTLSIAKQAGAVPLLSPKKSRAAQMNYGTNAATGDVLYFVHADVQLLHSFTEDIITAIQAGFPTGCYRYQFDSPRRILRANAYFTRFNGIMCRGGDQTLFIKKEVFNSLNGFNEKYVVMEDYDMIQRIQRKYPFKIIPKDILVSARKYDTNSWARVQVANIIAFLQYFLNRSPEKIALLYKKMLNYR